MVEQEKQRENGVGVNFGIEVKCYTYAQLLVLKIPPSHSHSIPFIVTINIPYGYISIPCHYKSR